jgi:ABC-type glycerol-3-phosphate transport system permease component
VDVPPAEGRMARHLRLLGVLWIVFSVMHLFRGGGRLLGARVFHLIDHSFGDVPWAWPVGNFFGSVLSFVGAFSVIIAIACFVAGYGLLEHRSWARSLAIALAVIALLHPILGTLLGIYTLCVLLPAEADEEYRRVVGTV